MASVVGICNEALQRLGEGSIASITADSKAARECNTAYEPARDFLLRKYKWNFAVKRASLAAESDGPEFGPTNYFQLPTNCLRLLPPSDADLDWIVENNKIATYWSAPLEIRYIAKITDPNEMDALFRSALAMEMARRMCRALTNSNTMVADIKDDLREILNDAKRTNAMENISEEPPEDEWITVRDSGRLPHNTRFGQ